jgi:hypothetical protein
MKKVQKAITRKKLGSRSFFVCFKPNYADLCVPTFEHQSNETKSVLSGNFIWLSIFNLCNLTANSLNLNTYVHISFFLKTINLINCQRTRGVNTFLTYIRVTRWYIFNPKIPIWVNFVGFCSGIC